MVLNYKYHFRFKKSLELLEQKIKINSDINNLWKCTNTCKSCSDTTTATPSSCAAARNAKEEAQTASTLKSITSAISATLVATTATLQSSNAVSGMSYLNLVLALSTIESIANMQSLNINHSIIALGAYSGLASSILPDWIGQLNNLDGNNTI